MKKFLKTLFSLIFAIALTTPTSGFAAPVQELDETAEERTSHSVYSDHYTLTFLKADFGLSLDRSELEDQAGSLIVFITNPEGKIVRDEPSHPLFANKEATEKLIELSLLKIN